MTRRLWCNRHVVLDGCNHRGTPRADAGRGGRRRAFASGIGMTAFLALAAPTYREQALRPGAS
jgi:hypothetical protein